MLHNSFKLNLIALAAQANQLAVTSTETTSDAVDGAIADTDAGGFIEIGTALEDPDSTDLDTVGTIVDVVAGSDSPISSGINIATNIIEPENTQYAKYTGCQALQVLQNTEFKGRYEHDMRQELLMCYDNPDDDYTCIDTLCTKQIR